MNKITRLAIIICAAAVLQWPEHAQQKRQKESALKPALSASESVLLQWKDIGRKLIAMAEDFPENKYDFKPTPVMQILFAERLIHAAHANQFFINALVGQKAPAMDDPKRDQFKTKNDVVSFVKKSFSDGAGAIKTKGDKGWLTWSWTHSATNKPRSVILLTVFVEHSGEIYGQLTVYYRVAGMVPPESRPKH